MSTKQVILGTKNSQDSLGNPSWFLAPGNYYYWYILSIQNKHHGHSGSYWLHTVPIYILSSKITSAYPHENRRNNTQRPVGTLGRGRGASNDNQGFIGLDLSSFCLKASLEFQNLLPKSPVNYEMGISIDFQDFIS